MGLKGVGVVPQRDLRNSRKAPEANEATEWVVQAYQTHFKYVWALLGRLGIPEANLEDVTQEVFIVLHRRRSEFRGDSSVRTWLHGITLRTARRHRDKLQRRRSRADDIEPGAAPRTPEAEVSTRQDLARLDRLLATLSDDQREVFVMAEIAEQSAPDIARLLGIKLNTVYSRLRLARRRLRQALDADQGAIHGTA